MAVIEFVGQSAQDTDNVAANPSRLVNFYREPVVSGGRTRYLLKSVPGLTEFADIGESPIVAMQAVGTRVFVIANGSLYRFGVLGVVTLMGGLATGDATISSNNNIGTFCAGGRYWTTTGATISEPDPAGEFTAFGSVEFSGNFTILTELDGRRFRWSAFGNPDSLPALNFATAEGSDEDLVRAFEFQGLLWLFKGTTSEVWEATGRTGAEAFQRVAGGVKTVGLKGFGLVAKYDGGAFFVGHDGKFYIARGVDYMPVSTPPVETAIAERGADKCFWYEDRGHKFLCIKFTDGPAWCYDLATAEWHERAEGEAGAWTAVATARFNGGWYFGMEGGKIGVAERNNADIGQPLIRTAVSRTLYNDSSRITLSEFELFTAQGTATATITWNLSKDSGFAWGIDRTFVTSGAYDKRLKWTNLGQFRQVTAKVQIEDAVEMALWADGRVVLR
jgi:hypothetical protein